MRYIISGPLLKNINPRINSRLSIFGGAYEIQTHDLYYAIVAL